MKKRLSLLSLSLLLASLIACSKDVFKEEDIISFVKEYKTEEYTIKDPNHAPTGLEIADKVEKYLSKEALDKQKANRIYDLVSDIAKKTNNSITLEDVIIEKTKENDNGTWDYNYTMKLKFDDGESSEIVEKNGQLTISNENGLKITRDWEEKKKIDNEFF